MTSIFLQHELKSFWRSKNTGQSIAVRIILGIFILYLLLCALGLGFFMDKFLQHLFTKQDEIVSFCGIILIYYLFELLSRVQMQELPTLKVQPYLQLPVRRNSLVRYLSLTSLVSTFNFLPLLLFWPFIFKVIAVRDGGLTALIFIIALLGFTIFNNYLALYVKRKANLNALVFFIFNAILVLFSLGDFVWHFYSISKISYLFFGNLIYHPVLVLVPVVLAVAIYYINFLYLKQNLYLEELNTKKATHKSSTEYPILNRFGAVGDLVSNEIKLILRNKRPNSALKMGLIFLFYGLIFYKNPTFKDNDGAAVFVGMFMTGFFIISYGQFMFSWQAAHFDGLLVSKLKIIDFFKAKYLLFTIVSTLAFLLTLPYAYFGWHIVLIHFVMYLWNIGVNTTIVLFFANRNAKRIDLSKGAAFNWEGVGASQWVLSLPLLLAPFIVYVPLKMLGYSNLAVITLGVTGLVFIFSRGFWLKKLTANFYKNKFKIAEGFRNK